MLQIHNFNSDENYQLNISHKEVSNKKSMHQSERKTTSGF